MCSLKLILFFVGLMITVITNAKNQSPTMLSLSNQFLMKNNEFIFSPLSIEMALSMAAEGSAKKTALQFSEVSHLPLVNPDLLLKDLNIKSESTSLQSVQKIWIQKNFPTDKEFSQLILKKYLSQIEQADFVKNAKAEVKKINSWVLNNTNSKIKDLVPDGAVDPLTKYILVNAIYFKSTWLSAFSKKRTQTEDFFITKTKKSEVKMMNKEFSQLSYFENNSFKAIRLPYKSDQLTMSVIVPKAIDFEFKSNDLEFVLGLTEKDFVSNTVQVSLPRFTSTFEISLKPFLKNLGLLLPFSEEADFSKMSPLAITQGLRISDIFHKAYIEVNEKGSEAAAATAVVVATKGMILNETKVFKANQPFLYLIKKGEQILFVGYFKG
jgi:serpin B